MSIRTACICFQKVDNCLMCRPARLELPRCKMAVFAGRPSCTLEAPIALVCRETQYTGPGHGIDAHVADRARLHARVYNCTTQLQGVLDNGSFDLVPSHAGEKITNANTNHTRELEWAGCKKSKKGVGVGNTLQWTLVLLTRHYGNVGQREDQRGTH